MEHPFLNAKRDDALLNPTGFEKLSYPEIAPAEYYISVATEPYFKILTNLRHHIKCASDYYFSEIIQAKNIDLFLMTSSVSSPSGPGSDSIPIPISFGGLDTYLVDSSQFGFEPVLTGGTPKAYCYLASMRGEDPDKRHLNQFYHCEYEAQDDFRAVQRVAEGYVRTLAKMLLCMPNTVKALSQNFEQTQAALTSLAQKDAFKEIRFDDAVNILLTENFKEGITESEYGFDITSAGERKLLEILHDVNPIWISGYHRDRVPFYQKPIGDNPDRVLNADLLFPALVKDAFAGEILGMGQRQDDPEEMYESMRRQNLEQQPYEWYVNLRRLPEYKVTSGFGLGIERFIAWSLGIDDISKVILYPRIKGLKMNP